MAFRDHSFGIQLRTLFLFRPVFAVRVFGSNSYFQQSAIVGFQRTSLACSLSVSFQLWRTVWSFLIPIFDFSFWRSVCSFLIPIFDFSVQGSFVFSMFQQSTCFTCCFTLCYIPEHWKNILSRIYIKIHES